MEYFIVANSFAAPFCSDQSTKYVESETPEDALTRFFYEYNHPCGLYSANCYRSADDWHKGRPRLAGWISNHARRLSEETKNLGSYGYRGNGPGSFEVNGKETKVENPKHGQIVVP